jgi:asparaginyl-tRNA synthetase
MGLGSDSQPVKIQIGGADTFLADSMQFMLEFGCRLTPNGCYYLMPSFRGEPNDKTHLHQFYHSEAEIPGTLEDVMTLVESYIRHITLDILDTCMPELVRAGAAIAALYELVDKSSFRRITFDEAADYLGSDGVIDEGRWRNITRQGERRLMEHFGQPLWVTHWDDLAVPFYQATDQMNGMIRARNADLLLGPGEIAGCGERHANVAAVVAALQRHNVQGSEYGWYLDMKAQFPLLTSGFGMGVERYLLWLLDHDDIRDLQLVPRAHGVEAAF